jgi:hypothetical protein
MKATLWRALGALAGASGGVPAGIALRQAFKSGAGWVVLALVALTAVTVVLYIAARGQTTPDTAPGELMPGVLLGLSTAINAVLLEALFGPIPAIVICAIPILAVIAPLARTNAYQAFLGWANLVLPMSWPIVAVGLGMVIVSALLALANLLFRTQLLKIDRLALDAKTGTTFMVGGLAGNGNLRAGSTGFNMGSFAFLKAGQSTTGYLVEHEAGHALNLAIWGFVVHVIGALDENVFGGNDRAYTELFAEGNVPPTDPARGASFPMWSEPVSAPTPFSKTTPTPAPAGT